MSLRIETSCGRSCCLFHGCKGRLDCKMSVHVGHEPQLRGSCYQRVCMNGFYLDPLKPCHHGGITLNTRSVIAQRRLPMAASCSISFSPILARSFRSPTRVSAPCCCYLQAPHRRRRRYSTSDDSLEVELSTLMKTIVIRSVASVSQYAISRVPLSFPYLFFNNSNLKTSYYTYLHFSLYYCFKLKL
jgi:hypothetical protein